MPRPSRPVDCDCSARANSSNTRASMSGAMPMPSSRTRITALSASRVDGQPDVAARLGVFRRVVEQVGCDLRDALRIGFEVERRRGDRELQSVPAAPSSARRSSAAPARPARAASMRDLRSSNSPRLMRARSSRSSTRRPSCWLWRSSTSSDVATAGWSLVDELAQDRERIADRRERIAQLVAEDREELVLAAAQVFERRARSLLGAFQGLVAMRDVARRCSPRSRRR